MMPCKKINKNPVLPARFCRRIVPVIRANYFNYIKDLKVMNRSQQFNITLAETKKFLWNESVISSRPIYFEYVSKHRRIIVVGQIGKNCFGETVESFVIEVSYKRLSIKQWSTRWGVKSDAIAWAKCYANNREIITGAMTIKEAPGKQII